jgi:hypothetical protein
MTSFLRTLALAVVAAGAFAFVNTPEAKAQRLIYTNYYATPVYAGNAVTYRGPFLGRRTAFYAPAYVAPVVASPTVVSYAPTGTYYAPTTTYYAPTTTYYGGTVIGPTVTSYPSSTVYYGGTAIPAVSYPLPSLVYPPAVFP